MSERDTQAVDGPKTQGQSPALEGRNAFMKAAAAERRYSRAIVWAVSVAVAALVMALGLLYVNYAVMKRTVEIKDGAPYVDVRVEEGDSLRSAVRKLNDAGAKLPAWAARIALRLHGSAAQPMQTGVFRVPDGTTPWTLVDILTGPPLLNEEVRIPDGSTYASLKTLFAGANELKNDTAALTDADFAKAVGLPENMSPEGWFAPDTYRYASGTADLRLWRQAYRRQKTILDEVWATRPADTVLKSPYEALILASIIEKETGHGEDRGLVSSVFHNRLKKNMPLQTDPTVIYGLGPQWAGKLTRADLRRPTPYNTYVISGLPPTPIAMPTRASIEAAVHPTPSDYLFFVARGDGRSVFTSTLSEHNRAVDEFILKKRPANRPTTKGQEK